MDWNLQAKAAPDDLKLQYNARYYKTRYGHYKALYARSQKKDMADNKLRYEVEAKKKEAEALKKQELEDAAFEKQENALLEEFEAAKESKDRAVAIQVLLKSQLTSYQKSIEWAKTAAVDTKLNDRAKAMAKKAAQWEQKKYITLRNEIHQDNIKQEQAKEEAEKEAKEAEEQRESAGIELDSAERSVLYADIKRVSAVVLTGDPATDDALLKTQVGATADLATTYKKNMLSLLGRMVRGQAAGTLTAEEEKTLKERYYKAKQAHASVATIVEGLRQA